MREPSQGMNVENGEKKRGRKGDKLRVIGRREGPECDKDAGRMKRGQGRREGTVIDCLVSPHAPVTELIGVAKTKRREVSVTSEPFKRAARVRP